MITLPGCCRFEQQTDGRWKCRDCGNESRRPTQARCVAAGAMTLEQREAAQLETLVDQALDAADVDRQSLPLGDWTAAGLTAVGLTKERVAGWLGKEGCGGCERRQEALNRLGQKIVGWLRQD